MSTRLVCLLAVIASFGLLTVLALADVGYLGIFEPHFRSWGGGQVFADLAIACGLAALWMLHDAPKQGLTAWPFIVMTLFLGSFGPLLYLAVREWKLESRQAVPA